MNLFQRVAFVILLPLAILIGMLTVQSLYQYKSNITKDNNRNQIHTEIIAARLEGLGRELAKAAALIAESKDSSRAVKEHDLDYLYDWTGLFHSTYLDRIIITDDRGNVLTRSYDQYRFSDNLEQALPIKTALEEKKFWGLTDIDGQQCFVYSRPVLLYEELLVGSVSVCARLTDELIEYLSDSHTVGIQVGENWPDNVNQREQPTVKSIKKIKTNFYPHLENTDHITISFYETEETEAKFRNRIIIIALLVLVMFLSLLLVYQVLSNYVRPYSTLVESFSMIAKKEVDFQQVRKNLAQITSVKNKEAGRIAQAFTELTYAIENDISQLEESAHRDSLTGLRNRRYCTKALNWEFDRHQQEEATFSIILADIDHFKMINDYFGHNYGDEILVTVAQIFRDVCRGTDIPARWGGEEFMVICPYTSITGCSVLAEKLRSKIEKLIEPLIQKKAAELGLDIPRENLPIGTLSLGCAVVRVSQHSDSDYGYEEADKALYIAKKERNCVVIGE